jgi:hypothetical protein
MHSNKATSTNAICAEDIRGHQGDKARFSGDFKMAQNDNAKYNTLILRIFIGLTVLFWGFEKLVTEELSKVYTMDYGGFMPIEVQACRTFFRKSKGKRVSLFAINQSDMDLRQDKNRKYNIEEGGFKVEI